MKYLNKSFSVSMHSGGLRVYSRVNRGGRIFYRKHGHEVRNGMTYAEMVYDRLGWGR